MIRVRAPSRLHFGLFSCAPAAAWPNVDGAEVVPARRFGGAGLMVDLPGLSLTARPAPAWSADGPLADRALAFARRFADTLPPGVLAPQRLCVEQCPPEHVGLGTGTQLGMTVGRALAAAAGLQLDGADLARRVGRGARSGLGVHGFMRGGFLVEGGKRTAADLAPVLAHIPFPVDWRIVLVLPPWGAGRHGTEEAEAFQQHSTRPEELTLTESLCRLVLLGLLPALAERDADAFGEALYDFNARAGQLFAPIQGGTYASPRGAELVAFLRGQGVRGVGQSSWGPAVFAVVTDADRAEHLVERVRDRFGLGRQDVLCTPASQCGAHVG